MKDSNGDDLRIDDLVAIRPVPAVDAKYHYQLARVLAIDVLGLVHLFIRSGSHIWTDGEALDIVGPARSTT